MTRKIILSVSLIGILSYSVVAQPPSGDFRQRQRRTSTRPPVDNERGLRELSPEEIPPNLNFYAIDPLYDPNVSLGWAEERIEEKINRGMLAIPVEAGKVIEKRSRKYCL